MLNKKILEIKSPMITYMQPQTCLMAILQADDEVCLNWIFSNYISLGYSKNLNLIEFFPFFEDGFLAVHL